MHYFFILGNHPRLSLAELICALKSRDYQTEDGFAVFEIEEKTVLNPSEVQNRLGGTVKVGQVVKKTNFGCLADDVGEIIKNQLNIKQKIYFGLSAYNCHFDVKEAALTIKIKLKRLEIASRWVQSRDLALSSVIVKTNKLLTQRGLEAVILKFKNDLMLGATRAVQPFDEFSNRDYGRPARDIRSGMLPPKIARIMINLSQTDKNAAILDPFCGSGTILQEAILLGYEQAKGSDISQKAIEDASDNLQWLSRSSAKVLSCLPSLAVADALHLSQKFESESIDAIVTEPYLGPPNLASESPQKIKKVIDELSVLYLDSFTEFSKILKPEGRIVIIFPVIKGQNLNILDQIKKSGFMPDCQFSNLYDDSARQSFLYGRPDQTIKREIFVFKRV
ncbi:MAG: methyltransferase domain-containing protein [Patescibacteria group bacterium]|mgnify:CR=1 FL=1